MTSRGKLTAAAAVLAVVTLAASAAPYITTAAFLLDLAGAGGGLRAWLPVAVNDTSFRDIVIPTRHGPIAARVHFPPDHAVPTVVVFPGVHGGGVDEPRLARFCGRLAATGYRVVCTPLPDLRLFRVTGQSTDVIEDVSTWVAADRGLTPGGRIGLVGVSFAGGLAMVAAGRRPLADRLDVVVSLGGYGSLERLLRYLCTGLLPDGTRRPPHDYGLAVAALAAAPGLVPRDQVDGFSHVVRTFLEASLDDSAEQRTAARLVAQARDAAALLPEPARSIGISVIDRNVTEVGRLVEPLVAGLAADPALSPELSPPPTAPVYLIHGNADNVIPSTETPLLAGYLARHGNDRVRWLLTPLVSHADVSDRPAPLDVWRLIRFWKTLRSALHA